jgi:UPF0755 protein
MDEKTIDNTYQRLGKLRDRLSAEWRKGANQRTIAIIIVVGAALFGAYSYFIAPPPAFPLNELVTINAGADLEELSNSLEVAQVVQNATALRLVITAMGKATDVKAGDYLFKQPQNIFAVAKIITTGAFGLEPERIRIHEGATTQEMATIFSSRLKRINAESFLNKARPYEGFLFPDTYYFLPNVSEEVVIETMRQNFDTHIETITGDIATFGRPLNEVVIMASLLEREARKSADRRMIAGVLWNRIEKNMLLQVDAAFLYTIGKATFDLTLDDLKIDDPYNTYKYKGLPPTPIGSPSLDSIQAAANPEKHNYIFYLADNHGTTYYSKTYQEHLAKKRKYLGT